VVGGYFTDLTSINRAEYDRQLDLLDAFGKLEGDVTRSNRCFASVTALGIRRTALVVDEKNLRATTRLAFDFRSVKITAARLQAGEEGQVEQEHHRASNASEVLQLSQAALDLLSE